MVLLMDRFYYAVSNATGNLIYFQQETQKIENNIQNAINLANAS